MEHNPFHSPSLYQSGKDLLREFHGLYQERETASFFSFSAFHRTAPSTNEITTITMEQMFFNTIRFLENNLCDKIGK